MILKATLAQTIGTAFNELMKSVGTSIPGSILAFDPATQLAQIQIGIVRLDVNGQTYTPPPIIECPVQFSGGDWTLEYELHAGNEGLCVFSQRCIDGWRDTGSVAEQPIVRFHDINDAMFIPGIRSQVGKITDFANNGIRIRNKAGSHYIWLKNDGTITSTNGTATDTLAPDGTVTRTNGAGSIVLGADGTVTINGVTIDPSGTITMPGGVVVNTHIHTQGNDSGGSTEQPTAGPSNP